MDDASRRVLVIAEACNPRWTSVPLVGYNLARALAEHPSLDVTVATQVRNEEALDDDPLHEAARIVTIDNEWVAKPFSRAATALRGGNEGGWTIDTAAAVPSYLAFEYQLHRRLRHELAPGAAFDLVHRVTPLSPTFPSPMVSWLRIPMVIGPLNGGLPFPQEFAHLRREEGEHLGRLRFLHRLVPYATTTFSRLAGVIVASRATAERVPSDFAGRVLVMPENGVDPAVFPIATSWRPPDGRFRFITAGRLVPLKGFDMLLEAIAGSPTLRAATELVIVGDGPDRPELEAIVRNNNLTSTVQFHGWLDQRALAAELATAQAFAFPSVKDFGGGVVLEAMAAGLPCVVVDYGGPGELIDDECGIAVPLGRQPILVRTLRAAMERLAGDHDECRRMSASTVAHVRERHTWGAKAEQISEFYDEVLRHAAQVRPRPAA
jgi:glycosyltransferase involved in cell wall biosynthesis